jgi:hypothetical protein
MDSRIGNHPKYVFTGAEEQFVTIPDEIRKCVVFVGYGTEVGRTSIAGTAFYVFRQSQSVQGHSFAYLITAKHVIDNIRNKGVGSVLLRVNLKNLGARWANSRLSDWVFHPSDSTVDVAILRVGINDDMDHLAYSLDGCLTRQLIVKHAIGIGDEVFLTGLFYPHYGKEYNVPIVRVGNIAAMPTEKVDTAIGNIDAYLVEARSIGGLSGSPVFVHIGSGMRHGVLSLGGPQFFMMGLMHGHFDAQFLPVDMADASVGSGSINMGIGIVVPMDKILEVLNQPAIIDAERKEGERIRKANLPAMD